MDDVVVAQAAALPRPASKPRWRRRWATLRKLLRVSRLGTAVCGLRHRRARRLIEIDITYACNLRCFNCNRSCEQAPTTEHMTCAQIERFVAETIARGIRWERIRLLGGEPTLHPDLWDIIGILRRYRDGFSPSTRLEIATNGYGETVARVLARMPSDVIVIDTGKTGRVQPTFRTFNVAPQDLATNRFADYRNGCWIIEKCGTGLGPSGYYPCAVAAGIDRIVGHDAGRPHLPDDEDGMEDLLARFCRLCGHFNQTRNEPVFGPVQSGTWRELYERHRAAPRPLTRYGATE